MLSIFHIKKYLYRLIYFYYTGLYPRDVKSGIICGGGKEPTIVKETIATALVQGHNLLGRSVSP